jgi:cytoskeletal protein CcmA (bactofilin family)
MADAPSQESKEKTAEPPKPEELKPQAESGASAPEETTTSATSAATKRRGTYRPSHKATFIGLAVILAVLAVNAGIISFVIKTQSSKTKSQADQGAVTLNPSVLNKLGVSRNSVGDLGTRLVIGPDSQFNGTVKVGGDVSIAGQLKLNSKFSANDASLTQLQAGKTSLADLDVNGDATVSTLNLRKDLNVTGATKLQGAVTVSQLFTVNNSVNIAGNLAVGGVLSVNGFHSSSLVSDSTITIGGHVITRGSAPGVGPGPGVGSNGTVSISGNDAAGTVAVNTGTGAGGGILANVAFRSQYGTVPHVVVTAVGPGTGSVYVNRTIGGFSIGVNGALAPGGYAFDYIVEQ